MAQPKRGLRRTIGRFSTTARLAIALALLILLPAIFYSAYELTSLTENEALLDEIYRQQLDVVLFSLNQYAWDVANSWANSINSMVSIGDMSPRQHGKSFALFQEANAGMRCVFFADSLLAGPLVASRTDPSDLQPPDSLILTSLRAHDQEVQHLFQLQTSGYRKLTPIAIEGSSDSNTTALVFVAGSGATRTVAGFVIDTEHFIRDVLGKKLNEVAGNNFLLAVNRKGTATPTFQTGDMPPLEFRQTKQLWLFPNYLVGIRLKGQTIDELARERFYHNIALITLLDLILIAGAWFVYRTVKKEMELAQLKSDFVSNVSHELKTPLSLIRMFGETLQMKRVPTEEKKQEYYDTIVQETERLTRLVNNILNFSRMEAGRKEYHLATTDLNDIVRQVITSYESHLTHLGFSISLQPGDSLPPIRADREAVSEALLNIVDNAVKYSTEEKRLRIATGTDRDGAWVEVEDHGIGIEPHHQEKIFEKFYRVPTGLVHNTKGSGLGLTLVRHIVDAHNGTITVTSTPGKGSTFRLSFPPAADSET